MCGGVHMSWRRQATHEQPNGGQVTGLTTGKLANRGQDTGLTTGKLMVDKTRTYNCEVNRGQDTGLTTGKVIVDKTRDTQLER